MNLPVVIVGLSTMKVVGAWPRRPVAAPPVSSRAVPKATGKLTFTAGPSKLDARQRNPSREAPRIRAPLANGQVRYPPFPIYPPGWTGQAQAPHTALCRRCPFQKSEIATSSPPTGDIRLSGSGPNHPASAAIQTANPTEATAQTAHRP